MEDEKNARESAIKNGLDMLYLANCALLDLAPQKEIMAAMDLVAVYAVAKSQTMAAVTYYGLENWLNSPDSEGLEIDTDLLKKWQQTRDMAIRKNAMLDITREQLFAYMDENKIWYMPLKGSLLKDMYPKLGMRQMADNDILIDAAYRKQVYDYMVSLGYEGNYHEFGAHDEFLKKPFYNFEIHNALFSDASDPVWVAYYRNIKEKLLKSGNKEYEFHFRDEDFYIYMTVHAHNHHTHSGNGVRHLMDVQVFLEQTPAMDWDYIRGELTSLGVADYEKTVRSLTGKIFDKKCMKPAELETAFSTEELELLEFGICVGTYGNREVWTQNNLHRSLKGESVTVLGKIKYLWSRLTYLEGLYSYYPRLANYKILRPFLYVGRIFIGITQYGNRLWPEIKALLKIKR